MAQSLRKKFKRILKKGKASVRDISIITTQYLKDIHDIEMSPLEYQKAVGKRDKIVQNFMLARAHYASKFGHPINRPEKERPESPKDGQFFINEDYVLEKYNAFDDNWNTITEPIF